MTHAVTTQDERERLRIAVRKQFRIHGGVTEDAVAAAVAEVLAPVVERLNADTAECMEGAPGIVGDHHDGCPCRKTGRHRIHRCPHGTEWWSDVPDPATTRAETADQFKAALLDGLDQLERHNIGRYVSPGDVADLIHAVAAEVGR